MMQTGDATITVEWSMGGVQFKKGWGEERTGSKAKSPSTDGFIATPHSVGSSPAHAHTHANARGPGNGVQEESERPR